MSSTSQALARQLDYAEAAVETRTKLSAYCPVCGAACSEPPLYRYTAAQAASHFCPVTRNKDRNRRLRECIGRLWQSEACVTMRCSHCGFAFGFPFVGGDEEFYSILHEQKDYPDWRWDYDVAMMEAVRNFSGGRILDIGAGEGAFLRRLGPRWECSALEGSQSTRHALEALGVKVFPDLSAVAYPQAGTFQMVTLFQVLEHIAEFDVVLKLCRQLLIPGGRLVVTVPDGDAMIRQERLTGCHDMPPNHINKWTPQSLSRALRRRGFEVGQPMHEPPGWRNLRSVLHLKVAADAMKERSLAAQVYRIQNRGLRRLGLAGLGVPALVSLLPHWSQLRLGGAFALVGTAR